MKKFLIFSIFLTITFGYIPVTAEQINSGNLIISPSIQEIEAKPGNSYDLIYTVENSSPSSAIIADVNIETFKEGDVPGSTIALPFNKDNDLSKWIDSPKVEEFPAKLTSKKPIKLNIPIDAKPGVYFFAVVFQPRSSISTDNSSKSNLVIQTRLANLLFVNIAGDSLKQPIINNLNTNLDIVDIFFDKLITTYEIEVKGNSYYRTSGNIFLTDKDTLTTLNSTISDSLILPGGKKTFYECYENHIIAFLFVDKCKMENNSKLPYFGRKNLEVKIDYIAGSGSPKSTVATKQILFFPYKFLILILLIAALIIFTKKYHNTKKI